MDYITILKEIKYDRIRKDPKFKEIEPIRQVIKESIQFFFKESQDFDIILMSNDMGLIEKLEWLLFTRTKALETQNILLLTYGRELLLKCFDAIEDNISHKKGKYYITIYNFIESLPFEGIRLTDSIDDYVRISDIIRSIYIKFFSLYYELKAFKWNCEEDKNKSPRNSL
ncbi:MAG: hypothetical protein QG614_583 [Patescibacteria group bacterium]|nr:hypothetical protein [Patescibacteria group bacterium]